MSRLARVALLAALLAGCGDTQLDTSAIRNFDRPVDMTFACYGRLRVLGDNGVADPDDPVDFSAQPVGSCVFRHNTPKNGPAPTPENPTPPTDNAPEGQHDDATHILKTSMRWLQIAVQPTSGTITLISQTEAGSDASVTLGSFTIADGDPLTPGRNPLAVGSLPIAIATDTAGCHALTANAGSCDLSVIDLTRLAGGSSDPIVRSLAVTVPDGGGTTPLLARPSAMASVDLDSAIGVACPAEPVGIVYVAYPDCHAVAAIDAGTGAVVSSIHFDITGTPTIDHTGALSCPRQCGDDRDTIADGARPVTLDIVRDTRGDFQRLAVGLDNRPVISVVDLDATGLPALVSSVELEGDVGVTDVSISKQINMGGDNIGDTTGNTDLDPGERVEAEFVYAIATDATVRVAEVLVANEECDTQVDPRFLFDERDPSRMVCFGVGQPGTPPRRAGARSPGIQISPSARPVAVTIVDSNHAAAHNGPAEVQSLAGHFAYVALSNGFTAIVNVDDDNYPDTYLPTLPLGSVLSLGLPHQVRDAIEHRELEATNTMGRVCAPAAPIDTDGFVTGGPRADAAPSRVFSLDRIAEKKAYLLPGGHQTLCTGVDTTAAVSDLTFAASTDVRERTYPDWRMVAADENWFVSWEGGLSIDTNDVVVDGPLVRSGTIDIAGGGMRVVDAAHPFCAAGVEPFDTVTLRGCDPARGDAQCGAGETCYVHPDATVATGACLPTDRLEELAGSCRDYLISLRRYSVFESFSGELRLHERWHDLRTSPVSGCTSDTQCMALAQYEKTLTSGEHPKDQPAVDQPFTYSCIADTSRAPGPNRCVMTCSDDSQCDDGTVCRSGRCIEGIVPAPQCAKGLQRYDLHASDAFVVIGDRTGYLHPIIEDTASSRCIVNTEASPLLLGRIPLRAPPCTGDEPGDITPNPCSEPVQQTERVPDYMAGTCTPATTAGVLATRTADSIRFSNPGMTFSIVDPTYPGDAMCRQDRGGNLGDIPTVFPGYNLRFHVTSGFNVMVAGPRLVQPSNIVRAPDGTVWAIDAGDIDDTSSSTPNLFGEVVRINPLSPLNTDFVFQ